MVIPGRVADVASAPGDVLEHLAVLAEGLQLNFLLLIQISQTLTYPVDLLCLCSLLAEFLLVEVASTSLISGTEAITNFRLEE